VPAKRRILVGTASWTDASLLESKKWYPSDVKTPEDRLKFYASKFPFVEVDSSYYTLELAEPAATWVRTTPRGFVFDVKAYRLFTLHQTPPKMLPKDIREALPPLPEKKRNLYYKDVPEDVRDELWSRFEQSLEPLRSAGKLGSIIFQIPPWIMPTPDARAHLEECADRLDDYRIAIEFRNKYWLSDRRRRETLAFLRESGLAYVVVDEPQGFRSSVPLIWECTNPDLAVVRLHGRNAETWEKKGLRRASDRFNYQYSKKELEEFVVPVKQLSKQAREVHVTFNNNYQDLAQRNGEEFAGLLSGEQ
jgi:uncharacterized protein YecE (DUF72 family)